MLHLDRIACANPNVSEITQAFKPKVLTKNAYLICFIGLTFGFSSPSLAQERVYVEALGVGTFPPNTPLPFYGTAQEIDQLPDGTDVTPLAYSTTGQLITVLSPNGTSFNYSLFGLTTVPSEASPAGGNHLSFPFYGPANLEVVSIRYSDIVDQFGRPVDLVEGQSYEAAFWMRPTLFENTSGDQFYFDAAPWTFSDISNPLLAPEDGSVPAWSPDEWTEATVQFIYPGPSDGPGPFEGEHGFQWQFAPIAGSNLVGVGGAQSTASIFQTSLNLALVDFGPLLRLDTSIVAEVYPETLLDIIALPSLLGRVGNRHWAGEEGAFAESAFVFCKDPAQNFSCAVTPEQAQVFTGIPLTDPTTEGQGVWVQLNGERIHYQPTTGTTGAEYDATIAGVTVGYDHILRDYDNRDRLIGGVNLRYRTSQADVTESSAESTINTTGIGLGGSLTWYAQDGRYVDAQAQVMKLSSDLSTATLGTFVDGHKTLSYAVSVEAGKEIALNETWNITPQAQLSYSSLQEADYTDGQGKVVTVSAESLKLRVGVEVSQETAWDAEDGTTSRRELNAGVHVVKEFKPETSVDVSGTTLRTESDDVTGEITLGGTYNWSDDKYSVYGQVAVGTGLNSFGDGSHLRGTVGMRTRWE